MEELKRERKLERDVDMTWREIKGVNKIDEQEQQWIDRGERGAI